MIPKRTPKRVTGSSPWQNRRPGLPRISRSSRSSAFSFPSRAGSHRPVNLGAPGLRGASGSDPRRERTAGDTERSQPDNADDPRPTQLDRLTTELLGTPRWATHRGISSPWSHTRIRCPPNRGNSTLLDRWVSITDSSRPSPPCSGTCNGKLYRSLQVSSAWTLWAEFQPWSLRGMVLRWSSMMARRTAPALRSVLLGSHRLSRPLVCSLVGRCHGSASHKNTPWHRRRPRCLARGPSRVPGPRSRS